MAHPLPEVCFLLLLSTITGYVCEGSPWMGAVAAVLTFSALIRAFLSLDDPRTRRARRFSLLFLSLLIPLLAALISQSATPSSLLAPEGNEEAHRTISSMLIANLVACGALWTALLWSARSELPHILVAAFAAAGIVGCVVWTGWLLHEGSDVGSIRSGLGAAATVLYLAIGALLVGLRGCRERLNISLLLLLSASLLAVCAAGTVAAHFLVDESSSDLLRLLQPLSAVATGAAAKVLLVVAYVRYEKRALDFGYSARAAGATAACRILVKIFSQLCLAAAFCFGFAIDQSPKWQVAAYITLMASAGALQAALGYMRYKEPPQYHPVRPLDARSILLCVLAAVTAAGEIALLVLCHVHWSSLTPGQLGCLCLAAHTTHLATAFLVDRLRGVLRPLALPAGLLLLAAASSATLYGELTQCFPNQSRSPTIWLAASLAAAGAAQLLAIPAVECFKREAAEQSEHRAELQAAFRTETRKRLLQKRVEKERQEEETERKRAVAAAAAGPRNGLLSYMRIKQQKKSGEVGGEESVELTGYSAQ